MLCNGIDPMERYGRERERESSKAEVDEACDCTKDFVTWSSTTAPSPARLSQSTSS